MTEPSTTGFYVAGGTLRPDTPSYIERRADQELFDRTMAGDFCYVLTSRQMGKSSLMARAARRLKEVGVHTAIVDLTGIGASEGDENEKASADKWYKGVARAITRGLSLKADLNDWWRQREDLPALQRLTEFFSDVVLAETAGRVVIFVDEIDTTIKLPFADDFFAAIRACYNKRATEPEYNRLSFVLLGVASPSDLIKDTTRTPFNIGHRIDMTDFTFEEAKPLARGLDAAEERGEQALRRILHWTGGHPYLTQKLCQAIQRRDRGTAITDQDIDSLVDQSFLSQTASHEDSNLNFVRDWLTRDKKRSGKVLKLYHHVRRGKSVTDAPLSPLHNYLKLSGIVALRPERTLRVRNRVYERVFTARWAKETSDDIKLLTSSREIRRYVIWLLIASIIQTIAALMTDKVEAFYSQFIFYHITRGLSAVNEYVQNVALGEIFFVLLPIWFGLWSLQYLRRSWRRKTRPFYVLKAFLLQTLLVISILVAIFLAFWGLNYQRLQLVESLGFDRIQACPGEVESIGSQNIAGVNINYEQARGASELTGGGKLPITRDAVYRSIERAFQNEALLGKASQGEFGDPKPLLLSRLTTWGGVSGFYIPFTGEVVFNEDIPPFDLPMVIAHHKAHQRGYARESEANFIGYIVCINSTEPYVRYSGYLYGLKVLDLLSKENPERYDNLLSRINEGPRADLRERSEFWERMRNSTLSVVSRFIFNAYLTANRVPGGVKSYDEDVPLIISYYLKYPHRQLPGADPSEGPLGNLEFPPSTGDPLGVAPSLSSLARRVANMVEILRSNYAAAVGLWMDEDGNALSLGSHRPTPTERQLYDTLTFLLTSARSLAMPALGAFSRQRFGQQLQSDSQTAQQMWQSVRSTGIISVDLDCQWKSTQNNLRALVTAASR